MAVAKFAVRSGDSFTVPELYAMLRLRLQVLILETKFLSLDLDNNDLLPSTLHVQGWVDGNLAGNLRILVFDDYVRLGRVAVAQEYRKHGVGKQLMEYTLKVIAERDDCPKKIVLDARHYVVKWYQQFGFVPTGRRFVKADTEHESMEMTLGAGKS